MVGVGASAGGLEALTELLSKMPADAGVAILIVHHLDPSRPSLLVDILSRRTPMRVVQAVDGMLVEVGCAHVIPPITSMSVVAYAPPLSRIDLLSCRNLLIYLDPTLQRRVMPAFHFARQHEGVLMLGLSETVGAHADLFSFIENRRAKIFGKKLVPNRAFVGLSLPMPVPAVAARQPAHAPAVDAPP